MGTSNNSFASIPKDCRDPEFFIDEKDFYSTIGIIQENLTKYMKNSGNQ